MSSIQLSLALASREPKKLSEFYAFATNGDLQTGINRDHHLIVHTSGLSIQVYRPKINQSWSNRSNAAAVCLQQAPSAKPLSSINEWTDSLVSKGAKVISKPNIESFGVEVWLADPDGNHFLIFVPKN